MGNIPHSIHYKEAAKLVAVHNRTLLRHLNIADAGVTPTVTVAAVKKAFGIQPSFLADYFAGRDRAVTTGEALKALGMTYKQRHILWGGLQKPIAIWGEYGHAARRYSAKALGLMPQPLQIEVANQDALFRDSLSFGGKVAA